MKKTLVSVLVLCLAVAGAVFAARRYLRKAKA